MQTGAIDLPVSPVTSEPQVSIPVPVTSQPQVPIIESTPPLESPIQASPISLRQFFIPNTYANDKLESATPENITEVQDFLFSQVIEIKKNEREISENRLLK